MSNFTWLELSESDDFLSRNFIDNTHFWIKTRKVGEGFQESMVINQKVTMRILQKYVIDAARPDIQKCLRKFMKHRLTHQFLERYNTTQRTEFKRHLKKYIELFIPDCGFEIGSTDRYKIKCGGLESCIVARKSYNKDDEIKFLEGTFAILNPEAEMKLDKNDFSVFHTTSSSEPKLMLGPCRFINHNCEPNVKFSPTNSGIKVIALRQIVPGEEITVMYAPGYFGAGNKDCLCASCERLQRGYFDPNKRTIPEDACIEVGSSEDEAENDETVVIIINSQSEDESSNEDQELEEIVSASDSDSDPTLLDDKEYHTDAVIKARIAAKSLTEKLGLSSNENSPLEAESDIVGGRRLRKREQIRTPTANDNLGDTILKYYPIDNSIDSSESYNNEDQLMKHRLNRTLHKLFMTEVYKDENKEDIYDCLHCGVYFRDTESDSNKSYCPRCVRHQKVYGYAWPDTKSKPDNTFLSLETILDRISIGALEKRNKIDRTGRRFRFRHGGIVCPVSKNPRDQELDLKRRMEFEISNVKEEIDDITKNRKSSSHSPINSTSSSRSSSINEVDSDLKKNLSYPKTIPKARIKNSNGSESDGSTIEVERVEDASNLEAPKQKRSLINTMREQIFEREPEREPKRKPQGRVNNTYVPRVKPSYAETIEIEKLYTNTYPNIKYTPTEAGPNQAVNDFNHFQRFMSAPRFPSKAPSHSFKSENVPTKDKFIPRTDARSEKTHFSSAPQNGPPSDSGISEKYASSERSYYSSTHSTESIYRGEQYHHKSSISQNNYHQSRTSEIEDNRHMSYQSASANINSNTSTVPSFYSHNVNSGKYRVPLVETATSTTLVTPTVEKELSATYPTHLMRYDYTSNETKKEYDSYLSKDLSKYSRFSLPKSTANVSNKKYVIPTDSEIIDLTLTDDETAN